MNLIRATDAITLNTIVNDPGVYPLVCGRTEGAMDLSPIVANPHNHVLTAEHGAVVFGIRQVGLYEMTATVLPAWRGEWAFCLIREAIDWLFTHTNAIEVYARIPDVGSGVEPVAKALGFSFEFIAPRGWLYDGHDIAASVYSMKIQDWLRTADLVGAAEDYHASIDREFERANGVTGTFRIPDQTHDRHLGAMMKMIDGGQPQKAIIFYDRFASMMGYAPIKLCGVDPVVLEIYGVRYEVHGKNLFLVSPAPETLN